MEEFNYNTLCKICPTDCVFKCTDEVDVPFHKAIIVQKSATVQHMMQVSPTIASIALPVSSKIATLAMELLYQPKIPARIRSSVYRALECLEADEDYLKPHRYYNCNSENAQHHVDRLRKWFADNVSAVLITAKANSYNANLYNNMVYDLSTADFAFAVSLMKPTHSRHSLVMARYYATMAASDDGMRKIIAENEKLTLGEFGEYYRFMTSTDEFDIIPDYLENAVGNYVYSEVINDRSGGAMFTPSMQTGCFDSCILYHFNYKEAYRCIIGAIEITPEHAKLIREKNLIPYK